MLLQLSGVQAARDGPPAGLIRRAIDFIGGLLRPNKEDCHHVLVVASALIGWRRARPLFQSHRPSGRWLTETMCRGPEYSRSNSLRYANSTFSRRLLSSTACTVSRRFSRARKADLIAAALLPAAGFAHGGQQGNRGRRIGSTGFSVG